MTTTTTDISGINIRRLTGADAEAVEQLGQLDSAARPPRGELLGVEIEGRLLAAISLDDGTTIADPFSRTQELRNLLDLRARQLRGRRRARFVHRHRRAATSVAESAPVARGRVLTLRPF